MKNIVSNCFVIISFIILFNLAACSWEDSYKAAAKRSLQVDTDLILVPYPYNIFDKEARESITLSHYTKDELKEILLEHNLSWEELKLDWGWNEKEQHFEREVNYTSHYTNYSYDINIPIWIFGQKWFNNGIYPDTIFQQHIPSIYSKILKYKFSNVLDISSYDKIFKNTNEIPEIIVTIVVDQGGEQLYKAHPNGFPFLKTLKNESVYFKNARVGHLEAHTAVGHAAIGTGSFPKEMKTFSNEIYAWKDGKVTSKTVYQGNDSQLNLEEFSTLSLADVWDRDEDNHPVIISQCYAARASIGMAGHGLLIPQLLRSDRLSDKDFVYWANSKSLLWDTFNPAYSMPDGINKYDFYEFYQANKQNISSNFKAENRLDFTRKFHHFQASEFQVALDGETFRNSLQSELISRKAFKDGKTDLAFLTLKATDAVGHLYGWESQESEKILIATDMEIRKIFDFLRSHYGDSFILLVTADHGAAPMPEVSKASFLTHEIFFKELSELLPPTAREKQSVVKWITHSHLSLNREVMSAYKISEADVIEKIKSIKINSKPFFRKVWNRGDLD
ncbi:type I phosphodiesterase/nucleotide pyrophosphatase [Leptospira ognonensis]|uniref:Type I phosphodiesterase/nucleotide pyrophosphatase n=1 Tax=Leptospira ognonensis TaxID=2484945 RepID=A0A4R9K969_9LEPT|nr:alkaline phosphatase family protein [Leptospira ognonensis]TGL63174.1 type I phosphodiesterase/nucleotide pyrophosphatase [Leptospira ognonensis]